MRPDPPQRLVWSVPVRRRAFLRGGGRVSVLRRRHDADDLATAPHAELHRAVGEGEQRVVAAPTDQVTRVELRAPLTHEDLAGVDELAAVPLDAQALRGGVTTVPRAGRTLFVSHL